MGRRDDETDRERGFDWALDGGFADVDRVSLRVVEDVVASDVADAMDGVWTILLVVLYEKKGHNVPGFIRLRCSSLRTLA